MSSSFEEARNLAEAVLTNGGNIWGHDYSSDCGIEPMEKRYLTVSSLTQADYKRIKKTIYEHIIKTIRLYNARNVLKNQSIQISRTEDLPYGMRIITRILSNSGTYNTNLFIEGLVRDLPRIFVDIDTAIYDKENYTIIFSIKKSVYFDVCTIVAIVALIGCMYLLFALYPSDAILPVKV
jgi:hypothetical protein